MKRILALLGICVLFVPGCSGNRNEREADRITLAVIANDMRPVIGDFDPAIKGQLTRIRVAELSDELNDQGVYKGLKQDQDWCRPGYLCFDVAFQKKLYYEIMKVGSDGKVQYWWIRASRPQ